MALFHQLTETKETNGEPVAANLQRERHMGLVFGELGFTAPIPAARNMKDNCCHHWVIEVAIDPLSKGVCKTCGEEKLFRNHLRWAEIMPAGVMNGRRQANDSMNIPEQMREHAPLLAQSRYARPIAFQSGKASIVWSKVAPR